MQTLGGGGFRKGESLGSGRNNGLKSTIKSLKIADPTSRPSRTLGCGKKKQPSGNKLVFIQAKKVKGI